MTPLKSLATPMTTANLNAILKQLASYGLTVTKSPIVCTVRDKNDRKILSAARVQARGNWHVMCEPGLVTTKD